MSGRGAPDPLQLDAWVGRSQQSSDRVTAAPVAILNATLDFDLESLIHESLPNLSEEEIARLAVHRHELPGVEITTELVRNYPFGGLFAHAVGSVRRVTEDDLRRLDPVRYSATRFVGKGGVERFYERSLHGEVAAGAANP